ncbi:MAG: hypothetical protein ABGX47_06310 [Martelella sp.]|uniref:DUF6950 family protein n=1 Tax=Martelella sp. TaxID=1969699 RepID=UPI00324282FD
MLDLTRRPDWRPRLFAFISGLKTMDFKWGSDDCFAALAAGAVETMTGIDPAAPLRGRYHDEASAGALLADLGHDGLAGLMRSMMPEAPVAMARVGDIALVADDNEVGGALGVVIGARVVVLRQIGTGTMPLLAAQTAFKVG